MYPDTGMHQPFLATTQSGRDVAGCLFRSLVPWCCRAQQSVLQGLQLLIVIRMSVASLILFPVEHQHFKRMATDVRAVVPCCCLMHSPGLPWRTLGWSGCVQVTAVAYDNPIPGFKTRNCINLRLWAAKPSREFDLEAFNTGDYVQVSSWRLR